MKFAYVHPPPAKATKRVIFSLGWEILPHLAYCPDLIPSGCRCTYIYQVSGLQKFADAFHPASYPISCKRQQILTVYFSIPYIYQLDVAYDRLALISILRRYCLSWEVYMSEMSICMAEQITTL